MKRKSNSVQSNKRGKTDLKEQRLHSTRPARGKRVRPLAPRQFVDIMKHINDGLVVLDKNWHYVYVNQKAAAMLQRKKPSDLIGKHIWTEYPEGVGQPFHLAYEKAMREQVPLVFEEHYEPWDLWFENRIYPSADSLLILFTDITERKRFERLLAERQHLLQKILDTEPGTVYIYDLEERRNVYVNRHWLSAFGYTEEETQAMGEALSEQIFHPEDLSRIAEHHANWRKAGDGETRSIEYRMRSKAGEWHWLHSRETPFLRNESGGVRQILGIAHDVTERIRMQQVVLKEKDFSQALLNSLPGIFYCYDQAGDSLRWNKNLETISGYATEEILQMHPLDFFQREEREYLAERMQQVFERGASDAEAKFTTKKGDLLPYYFTGRRIEIEGQPYLIGMGIDITERKRTEEALAASEAELRALFTSMDDVVLVIDRDGVYRKIAPTSPNLLYKPPEELLGKTLSDIFPAEMAESFVHTIRQVIETQQTAHIEYPLIINGQVIWFDASITAMEANRTLWMVRDVTDRKRAEEKLRQLNEVLEQRVAARTEELAAAMIKAQESERLKSTFLATMSHELRTPLNSIIGFTGVILQGLAGPLNEEQTKQLTMTRNSARHLLALINDVLELSKIEAGQLEIVKRPFDMRQAIESALRVVQPHAQKKNLQVMTSIGAGVDVVNNDRRRVEQVLINLVSNAIKFSEHGEVLVECQVRDGWLETCVSDHGIGIQPEDLDRLFKPFQQIDTGLTRNHEGTGLGLSICKHLINAMGGEITVESKWGAGSTFTFTIPV